MRIGGRLGACVVVAGCVFAACGGGSSSLADLAAGTWGCTVKDESSYAFGSFDADARIGLDHTWKMTVRSGDVQKPLELEGRWELDGKTVSIRFTRSIIGKDDRQMRFEGVAKGTPAVTAFVGRTRNGKFVVKWDGDTHVIFRQTESFGSPSVKGGDGDAYVADCRKVAKN